MGSGEVTESTTDAMFVEVVRIAIPFDAVVYDGEPRKVVLRGEDNLLAQIDVVETEPSEWEIIAPANLDFEQHSDIEIRVPFIDMVSISYEGYNVEFADQPFETTREGEGSED